MSSGFKVPFFAFQATQDKLSSGFLYLGFWISDFGFIESLSEAASSL